MAVRAEHSQAAERRFRWDRAITKRPPVVYFAERRQPTICLREVERTHFAPEPSGFLEGRALLGFSQSAVALTLEMGLKSWIPLHSLHVWGVISSVNGFLPATRWTGFTRPPTKSLGDPLQRRSLGRIRGYKIIQEAFRRIVAEARRGWPEALAISMARWTQWHRVRDYNVGALRLCADRDKSLACAFHVAKEHSIGVSWPPSDITEAAIRALVSMQIRL
jgi:hypothetical protein